MSLEFEGNKKGLYQVKNYVSDELYENGRWLTEDEVKACSTSATSGIRIA